MPRKGNTETIKPMRMKTLTAIALMSAAAPLLGGCGVGNLMNRQRPDEFAVQRQARDQRSLELLREKGVGGRRHRHPLLQRPRLHSPPPHPAPRVKTPVRELFAAPASPARRPLRDLRHVGGDATRTAENRRPARATLEQPHGPHVHTTNKPPPLPPLRPPFQPTPPLPQKGKSGARLGRQVLQRDSHPLLRVPTIRTPLPAPHARRARPQRARSAGCRPRGSGRRGRQVSHE